MFASAKVLPFSEFAKPFGQFFSDFISFVQPFGLPLQSKAMSKPIIDFIIGNMNFSDNHNDNTILSVADLHIAFKSGNLWQEVVKGVNFSLKKGETLGLVGESGSGKSVSSLAIMGLLDKNNSKISHGSIIFNGSTELLQLKESLYRQYRGKKIAMIFQEPMTSLNPVKKCGNQLMEMILQHENCSKKEARNRTLELFKEVLLPDPCRVFSAYPHELSGGQKQRVMIAMAVSCKPDILIADEPTTALDVSVQKSILELIADVQKKYAMGVLFISHDLNLVHKIADRIAVIYKGEIVECGEKESIFNNPQHPYTKGLLACRPPLDCRPERLPTVDDYLNGKGVSSRTTVAADRQKAHADILKITLPTQILLEKELRERLVLEQIVLHHANHHHFLVLIRSLRLGHIILISIRTLETVENVFKHVPLLAPIYLQLIYGLAQLGIKLQLMEQHIVDKPHVGIFFLLCREELIFCFFDLIFGNVPYLQDSRQQIHFKIIRLLYTFEQALFRPYHIFHLRCLTRI